jgi:hypothetical protein
MPSTISIVYLILFLFAFPVCLFRFSIFIEEKDIRREEICKSSDFLRHLHKEQIVLAIKELNAFERQNFEGGNLTFSSEKEEEMNGFTDLGFYHFRFGTAIIEKAKCELHDINNKPTRIEKLSYYRLWKCGNNNIRAHLHRYSLLDQKNCCRFNECNFSTFEERCGNFSTISSTSHTKLAAENYKFSLKNSDRIKLYPFTFVRNPIARFISGYTEIEYRLTDASSLPIYSPLGSIDRFKGFIKLVLKYKGSGKLFSQNYLQIAHIAPMIGTFIDSFKRDLVDLKYYHMENFESEWNRLASDSGFHGIF